MSDLEPISENVSEKRRRGRPRRWSEQELKISAMFFPDVQTLRGKQNIVCQQLALGALTDDPRFYWITGGSRKDLAAGCSKPLRRTILQALGRLIDPDEIRTVALEVCRRKLSARKVIAMLREYRGVQKAGDALDLANVLLRALNRYLDAHSETTDEQIIEAVFALARQVDKLLKKYDRK